MAKGTGKAAPSASKVTAKKAPKSKSGIGSFKIKAMNADDYVEKKGIEKTNIERAVKINDKTQNLTVVRSFNHKKGSFELLFKWNMDAITGDDVIDTETLRSACQMMFSSRDECLETRDSWKNARKEDSGIDEENQMEMGFGNNQ